jgi:hypothetical protein
MDEDDELADTNNEELYKEDGNEVISENEGEEQTQEGKIISQAEERYRTRSGREVKQPERLNYVAYESILEPCDQEEEVEWSEQELLAYKASTDPDTMYYHQAIREPDKDKF